MMERLNSEISRLKRLFPARDLISGRGGQGLSGIERL